MERNTCIYIAQVINTSHHCMYNITFGCCIIISDIQGAQWCSVTAQKIQKRPRMSAFLFIACAAHWVQQFHVSLSLL